MGYIETNSLGCGRTHIGYPFDNFLFSLIGIATKTGY